MALKDWYAQNIDRINGIAKANNVSIEQAKGMLESNAKGTTNYKGGGVADMGELNRSYYAAAADGQAAFSNRNSGGGGSKRKSNGMANYYNNALKEQMKVLENARREQQRENYISNQMALKNLPEQMSAQGLSGGMTETALMGINADYQNARHDSDNVYNANLADLRSSYADKQASLNQWQTEFDANQEAQNYARQQDAYAQRLSEAQLYASYGDYSKLKELGISIPEEETESGSIANAYKGRGGAPIIDDPKIEAITPTTPTPYTDMRQSLIGGLGNVQSTALQRLSQQYQNGEIDLVTYKKLLGRIGYYTDGKMVDKL